MLVLTLGVDVRSSWACFCQKRQFHVQQTRLRQGLKLGAGESASAGCGR
jgi:hypothetical protein